MDPEPSITHNADGQQADTDMYGRRIARSRSTVEDAPAPVPRNRTQSLEENIEIAMGFARRLQEGLDVVRRGPQGRRDSLPQQAMLTYAETLHKGLKVMWIPMQCLGRIPFRLVLKNNHAVISVSKKDPTYIACVVTCTITWLLFLMITIGLFLLGSLHPSDEQKNTTLYISRSVAKLYWPDAFIFWTTMLQTCISTTHVLAQADRFALFIKAWYRILDLTKIEVSRTLKEYITKSLVILFLATLSYIIAHFIPSHFPHVVGTSWVVCIALAQPFIYVFDIKDPQTKDAHGTLYFQNFAFVGLVIYVIAIIFSWLYLIQFMVFCRCFRKGLKSINQRIAMILCVNDEPRVGPNALRLTYEYIHKDYLGIATTGIKIGQIFSFTMCNYYLWALGEIFKFAKRNYRNTLDQKRHAIHFEGTNILAEVPPIEEVTNNLHHLTMTVVCIFYISHEGAGAHKEGMMGYELARYKGLVNCATQLERNFIRSIWIIVTDKCQVHVSPGRFFGITYGTVMTVFATSFTYFVFYVQSVTLDADDSSSTQAGAAAIASLDDYEDD